LEPYDNPFWEKSKPRQKKKEREREKEKKKKTVNSGHLVP
jgi:hypothetical protein